MNAFFAANEFPPLAPGIHPHTHFLRLIEQRGWTVGSRNHRRATAAFNAALLENFAIRFGDEMHPPLPTWQNLCLALGARELPESITKCKKVRSRHPGEKT